MAPTGPQPFSAVASPDGHFVFVATARGLEVEHLRRGAGPVPALTPVRLVPLPLGAQGQALTPDHRHLVVAYGQGAVVLGVRALEDGRGRALVGTLRDPAGEYSAIEAAVSPDGRFVFVTKEGGPGVVAVFDLVAALRRGFGSPGVDRGVVPVGQAPVGVAVSGDGRWLYVTSEVDPALPDGEGEGTCPLGSLSVIRARSAEQDPGRTGRVVAPVGASPVRVALSGRGGVAWVTARASNAVVAVRTAALRAARPGAVVTSALAAVVPVGQLPVGVAAIPGGRLVVADSDRVVGSPGQWLSVVDTAAALAGRPALVGQIPAGAFPRDVAVAPGGADVLVANYDSDQVELVVTASIPAAP
jgi:DNA-binding beta-propeller fold protein YncE